MATSRIAGAQKATALNTVWDPATRRFTVGGEPVTRDQIRGWIQQALVTTSERLKQLAQEYIDEQLTLAEWADASALEIRNLHTALSVIANGGLEQMDAVAWDRLEEVLKFQIDEHFLGNFSPAVEAGMLSDAQMVARADLYAAAGWGTYQNELRANVIDDGYYDEEIRVVESANPCGDCLVAGGHWEEAGSLPSLGDSACLVNCQCEFLYRNSATGEVSPE